MQLVRSSSGYKESLSRSLHKSSGIRTETSNRGRLYSMGILQSSSQQLEEEYLNENRRNNSKKKIQFVLHENNKNNLQQPRIGSKLSQYCKLKTKTKIDPKNIKQNKKTTKIFNEGVRDNKLRPQSIYLQILNKFH